MNISPISRTEFYLACHHELDDKTPIPKVLENDSAEIIKLFYPKKRRFSSSKYRPYAIRFCQNADRLKAAQIKTPTILALNYCEELNTYLVRYAKVPGHDSYSLAQTSSKEFLFEAMAFIRSLHEKGIFFRSMHLSNLLYQEDKTFALIDISDVRFQSKALGVYDRYRNLKHAILHRDDKLIWQKIEPQEIIDAYLQDAKLSRLGKECLHFLMKGIVKKLKKS